MARLTIARRGDKLAGAMSGGVTIRLHGGRSVMLVDAGALESWDVEQARYRLRDAVADNSFVGDVLVRLADSELLVASWDAPVDEAIDAIARAIARGLITPVRVDDARRGLRPIFPGLTPIDWDNLQPLSDLQRVDPTPASTRPTAPVEPTWVDPCDAWMSFDVVDDRGAPADGEFHCVVDGQRYEGALARTTHTFRELSTSASGRVELTSLWFAGTVLPPVDGPVPGGTPTKPDDVIGSRTSFEVVDEDGRPLAGRYVVRLSGAETDGVLGGVVVLAEPGPASVQVLLGSKAAHG